MVEFEILDLVGISLVFLAGGIVKGCIGLGLPTISIGLMALWLPLEQAMGILILPTVITNIWQASFGSALFVVVRRLWVLMVGLLVGSLTTAILVVEANITMASGLLGIMLIIYAGLNLSGVRFSVPVKSETTLNPIIGISTGLIAGATAFFVIPVVPYLQSLDFGKAGHNLKNKPIAGTSAVNETMMKDALIQSFAVSVLVLTGGMALGLEIRGALPVSILLPGVLGTVTGLIGMIIGRTIRNRLSLEVFRRCILTALVGLGIVMVVRFVWWL